MSQVVDINFKKLDKPNTLLCELVGSLELSSTLELERTMKEVIENDRMRFIFDLSKADYINSQGLSALLGLQNELAPAGGGVIVISVTPQVRDVMELTGFNQAVNIYDDLAQALVQDELFKADSQGQA